MKRRWLLLLVPLLALLVSLPLWLRAQQNDGLPRSTPAAEGISTRAVINMMDSLQQMRGCDIHHVMVVRHGKVVAELHAAPFRAEDSHTLYSVSKLATALAVGVAVDENRLRLDDRVMTFFYDKMPDVISANMADVTVRDLLMMASGVSPDTGIRANGTDWVREWLAKPCDETPGKVFRYDSMCSFMLSAIVQRVTGRPLLDYLQEKIFTPMHITQVEWEKSPDGICTGGWGLRVQTETLAKLGVLMLNKGAWEGQQLVSADYVEQACSPLIAAEPSEDGISSYGYHLWNATWQGFGKLSIAMGRFGQAMVLLPEQDMVVVVLGIMAEGQSILPFLKNQLLPGVIDGASKSDKQLQHRLDSLCAHAVIYLPEGAPKGKNVDRKRLEMAPNSAGLSWAMLDGDTLRLARSGEPVEAFPLGYRQWRYGELKGLPPYSINARNRMKDLNHDFVTAVAYAWTSPSVLEVRIHYVNWIAASTYVFDFNNQELTFRDDFPGTQPNKIRFTIQ